MIFENKEKIISRGQKVTDTIIESISDAEGVIGNIFDGVYNKEEILQTFEFISKQQEVDTDFTRSVFSNCGMLEWCYQDLDGFYKACYFDLILLLDLYVGGDYDTIVISPTHHTRIPSNKGIHKGMKKILDSYKNLLKEFKNSAIDS